MGTIQRDMMSEPRAYYAEQVERRMQRQDAFGTVEAAGCFGVSETTVREWIEEGRLMAADLNAGRTRPTDPARPEGKRRPMRPYYRITRDAMLELARRLDMGI